MQTFLPYPSFIGSARVLDYRRLGKQRVEAYQIHRCLTGVSSNGWRHHPAVKMWAGYETALLQYLRSCIVEWTNRGYENSMSLPMPVDPYSYELPRWLGNFEFHASHRSNLLRKDYAHYSKFNWSEPSDLPYVWPAAARIITDEEVG